jgi:hypothetical protein
MRIVLHVGLHKTATTYLQREFFPRLGASVVYNPDDIFYFVNAIFTLGIREQRFLDEAARLARAYASSDDKRTLLLSSEALLQTGFDLNFQERIDLLRRIFPGAEIIVFLRNQLDWLESCYRESIKHHYYQGIDEFLGYKDGDFENRAARTDAHRLWRINVWKCNWAELLKSLREAFGAGKVHLLFYEEFRQAPAAVFASLFRIIDSPEFAANPASKVNKGLSSAAIAALIAYARILDRIGLRYPTYNRKFSAERTLVLEKPFHWRAPRRSPAARLLRALVMEPYRLIRRLDPVRVIKLVDEKFSLASGSVLRPDMREKLAGIYSQYNSAIENEFKSAEIAAHYRFGKRQ